MSDLRTRSQEKTQLSLRVLHKPCRGKKGGCLFVFLPRAEQKTSAAHFRIWETVLNSADIIEIQRMSETASTGKKIGMSRIDDRIAWLGEVSLAHEHEMLRPGAEKVGSSGEAVEHLLRHDDMLFITVNRET